MSSTGSQESGLPKSDEVLLASICDHGWSQGDALPIELSRRHLEPKSLPPSTLLVVISHDCDIIHHSFANEPTVEVLICTPIREAAGDLTQLKNPRRLHLPVRGQGENSHLEVLAYQRFFINRKELAEGRPNKEALSAESRDELRQWLAKRYVRAAFPSEFDRRAKGARGKIRKALDSPGGKALSGLYIFFQDDRELAGGTPYRISIWGTMKTVPFEDPATFKGCEVLIGKIAACLSACTGIEVLDHDVKSEAKFSLDDVRLTKRWDADFLSIEDGEAPAKL